MYCTPTNFRFEIALKIDADQILIPCLLPQDEDVTYSIPSDLKYFERQISFKNLPSGFIPRILVSTLSYILSVSNEVRIFSENRHIFSKSNPFSSNRSYTKMRRQRKILYKIKDTTLTISNFSALQSTI